MKSSSMSILTEAIEYHEHSTHAKKGTFESRLNFNKGKHATY